MKEVWRDIKGYEGLYQISNYGIVKRLSHKRYDRNQILKERIVKTTYPKNGWYPYLSLCKNGNFIKEWFSTRLAEKELHITNGKVSQCCIGNRKSAGGFIWKYKEEL